MAKTWFSVTGSRTWPATMAEYQELSEEECFAQTAKAIAIVATFINNMDAKTVGIVSGGAIGPDTWAVARAKERGMETKEILPEWEKLGKTAGFARNKQIAEFADECLVFWDGVSNGTKQFIRSAFNLRKPLYIIGPTGNPWALFDKEFYSKEKVKLPKLEIPGER